MYLFIKISIHINQRTGMTGVWKSKRTAENISRHLYIYIYISDYDIDGQMKPDK